jgi:hypothetical protein
MKQELKLEGWKMKEIKDKDFLECPYCKGNNITGSKKKDFVICNKCKMEYPVKELKEVTKQTEFAICKFCDFPVSLTSDNVEYIGNFGYLCPRCFNIVAIKFNENTYQEKDVLNLDWNKSIFKKSIHIQDNLYSVECRTKKDILILKILQAKTKIEDREFLYFKEKEQKACLVFDNEIKKYIGYIVWSEEKNIATLRQIYIVKEERNKKHATKLLKFWVENYADKLNKEFIVESPNNISIKILINLGYAEKEENYFTGKKCSFVWS